MIGRVWTIAEREFRAMFLSPIAYVVISAYIGYISFIWWLITASMSRYGVGADYRPIAGQMHVFLLFVVPAISMRVLADEKRTRTLELLVTQPVRDAEIVFGKWLACVGLLVIMLAGTLQFYLQMRIWADGALADAPVWVAYLGLLLAGMLYMAIGVFFSSITENQVVAALLTFLVIIVLYFLQFLGESATGFWQEAFTQASTLYHFEDFAKGVLDTGHIGYYLLLSFAFLFIAVRSLESRSWG